MMSCPRKQNNVDACQWLQHGRMTDDDCAPLGCSSMSGIKFKLQWHQRASNFTCINFSFQVPSSCRGWNAGQMTPQSPVTHTIMWPSCEHHVITPCLKWLLHSAFKPFVCSQLKVPKGKWLLDKQYLEASYGPSRHTCHCCAWISWHTGVQENKIMLNE